MGSCTQPYYRSIVWSRNKAFIAVHGASIVPPYAISFIQRFYSILILYQTDMYVQSYFQLEA